MQDTEPAGLNHGEPELWASESQFRSLVANIPGGVYRCSTSEGWPMFFMSDAIVTVTGYPASDFLHNSVRSFASIIHPDDLEMVEAANTHAIHTNQPFEIEYRINRADGRVGWVYEKGNGAYDSDGNIQWIDGVIFDITERKKVTEFQQYALQQETIIQLQNATIAELSAPLMPLSDRVMVMPLIGAIDALRAEQIIAVLLEGIANATVETVIIDVTGITLIDTHVAGVLINAARGARLLGATIILTGIRPEMAQTIVSIGVEFEGLMTLSTLQRGVAFALKRQLRS